MGKFRTRSLTEFGSLNEDSNPQALRENELTVANNCWQEGNEFGTRPGVEYEGAASGNYAAVISGTPAVQELYEFQDRAQAESLLAIAGGVVYWDHDSNLDKTTDSITINSGQDYRWTFAEHKGNLYAAGGKDGDYIWKWDGVAANKLTRVTFQDGGTPSDIDAKYIYEKWNYGFLAGMNGTRVDDNPMIVRYSALNDMDTWPVANTMGGTSAIGGLSSYGTEAITGFSEYTDNRGDWLLILSNKRLYSVLQRPDPDTPFRIDSVIQNGCVGPHAFVSLGLDSGDAIYISENGIHSLRQSQQHGNRDDTFLSWKIRDTFAGLSKTRLKYATGTYWPDYGVVLFTVPESGATTQSLILCCEIRDAREITRDTVKWRLWRLSGLTANTLMTAKDASTGIRRVYGGGYAGQVFRFNTTIHDDLSSGIYTPDWTTKHEDFGAPELEKGVGDIWVSVGPAGTYHPQVSLVFDYGVSQSTAEQLDLPEVGALWATSMWGIDVWANEAAVVQDKVYGVGSGHTVALRFVHSGDNEPFFVSKAAYQIRTLGESAGEA